MYKVFVVQMFWEHY